MTETGEDLLKNLPRGTIKSFREYLDKKYAGTDLHEHNKYHQHTRGYGSYLYHQDRWKFDVELIQALQYPDEYKDWKRP